MKELLKNQKTTFLSTINENDMPQASYAPYVMVEDTMYIYISQIAEHYKNLEQNSKVSVMIIEDESNSKILFARKRLSFSGKATKITDVPAEVWEKFDENHTKNLMDTLKGMDFDIFKINLEKGRLVEGFGKAFDLVYENGDWKQEHVVLDGGHKNK